MKSRIAILTGVLLFGPLPVRAHHSLGAEFDPDKRIKVTGKVTKIEWMNPHAWLYLDVQNQQGQIEKWQFEFGAPNELRRRGWKRTDLTEGQEVTIEALVARKGGNAANARSIVLPDGRQVFSSFGNPPRPGNPRK